VCVSSCSTLPRDEDESGRGLFAGIIIIGDIGWSNELNACCCVRDFVYISPTPNQVTVNRDAY
jgi:hypothetical protein